MEFTINEVSLWTVFAHPFSRTGSNPQGDLLHDGYTRTFTWSGCSEILSVTTQVAVGTTVKESFTYDGLQRRISRTDASGTTFFIHDGWNVIAEYRRVGTANVLQRRYLWGEDLSGSLQGAGGVGGLVQAVDYTPGNAGSYHYHYDGNGNIVEITNVSAAVVASYRYDAFGRTLAKSGIYADANRYRFSTKPVEHTSALYYYGYRFYDPTHGRWTTRDPIGEKDGVNRYALSISLLNGFDKLGLLGCENGHVKDEACVNAANEAFESCKRGAWKSFRSNLSMGVSGCAAGCIASSIGYPACFATCVATITATASVVYFMDVDDCAAERDDTIENCPCVCKKQN